MTTKTSGLLPQPYWQFVQGVKAAWEGELSGAEFDRLFDPACICHMQGNELHSAQAFQHLIHGIRRNIAHLQLIPQYAAAQDDRVYLIHRWQAQNWHQDVVAGGRYSNFCQLVIRLDKNKIVELWQPAQNFLFLLGEALSGERLIFPAWPWPLAMWENGQLSPASDLRTQQMAEHAQALVGSVFGQGSLRQVERLLDPALKFYNGDIAGQGIAEWKSFIYALRTAIGEGGLAHHAQWFIRDGHCLTLFIQPVIQQEASLLLPATNGMLCMLQLEMTEQVITQIRTYPENYIFFLGLDFSQHHSRLKQLFRGERQPLVPPARSPAPRALPLHSEQVAVVGVAGRFPMANSPAILWQNLLAGNNAFSPFPPDRPWLSSGTVIRHGGFINDVFRFAEHYFHISPLAAQYMDPQQRLWLETIVQSIEDSGHSNRDLSGDRTALFIASLSSDYEKLLRDRGVRENFHYWAGNEQAMSLGQIARFLDIQGPAQFINTECTSGISALLAASNLIRSGQVDQAIVSAASLFLHPYGFITREEGVLSPAAAPELFSKRSKGQLRGEAVVAVVLKSLTKARQDGDDIYAIVAGGAVNNSGKTFSLIAANVEQQAKVIRKAWIDAGVSAADLSVIECNASGVRTGDFAEITALKKVFPATQQVELSTIKGAIGHTEAASGLVALVKVLWQLRQRIITGIQGLGDIDENLGLAGSGLALSRQNRAWLATTKEGKVVPRVAGINAFAGGGYNAHLVIKEFIAPQSPPPVQCDMPLLIPLSAHSQAALCDHIARLKQYLQEQEVDLARLAFTLQQREARQYRVMLQVTQLAELLSRLDEILNGTIAVHNSEAPVAQSAADPASPPEQQIARWLRGEEVCWSALWRAGTPQRLAGIPVRDWLGAVHLPPAATGKTNLSLNVPQQSYHYCFSGTESYLRDHRVGQQIMLPGVVQLELVRHAAMQLWPDLPLPLSLRHVGWLQPVVITAPAEEVTLTVTLDLATEESDDRTVSFTVTAEQEGADISAPVSRGSVVVALPPPQSVWDRERCQQYCQQRRLSAGQCYAMLATLGIEIGVGHRAIAYITTGKDEEGQPVALAKLTFSADRPPCYHFARQAVPFLLSPALLDGALQAGWLGVLASDTLPPGGTAPVPFAIDDITILHPLQDEAWAWIKETTSPATSAVHKMDIVLSDSHGVICVVIKGFSTRTELALSSASSVAEEPHKLAPPADSSFIISQLKEVIGKGLGVSAARLRAREPLAKYGIDSMIAIQLTTALEKRFGSLPKTLFYEYKCIADLAHYLSERTPPQPAAPVVLTKEVAATKRLDIAIIGISARYPLAENCAAMWGNLQQGKRCITEIPPSRWTWQHYYHGDGHASKWGGFIAGVEEFDYAFFDLSAHEAATMDPQERIFLQQAWAAIEDAGYTPATLAGASKAVGVYVGSMYSEYQLYDACPDAPHPAIGLVSCQASIANRLSYLLDFQGPSITVDAMCSASMVAIDAACRDLQRGVTRAAIAGGVNLTLHPNKYLTLSRRKMLSPASQLNTFGVGGSGYIPGEGVGMLVLKRLADAVAEGAHIYGVISGSAVNQNGRSNGFGAPDPQAQQAVIEQAMQEAEVSVDDISYIEAHGTGTQYGDLIEVSALAHVFRQRNTEIQGRCQIGSGKGSFGHCEAAAGVGSIIKVVLQMQHQAIPPTLYGEKLNPEIDFARTPFAVSAALIPWTPARQRIAGISCFGAGGTNAHLIVEQFSAPEVRHTASHKPWLILLSAKNSDALLQRVKQLQALLTLPESLPDGQSEEILLERLAFTLQVGREHMAARVGLRVTDRADLRQQLAQLTDDDIARVTDDAPQFATPVWQEKIASWLAEGNDDELLKVWLAGGEVAWQQRYPYPLPERLSGLPTYPFAPNRVTLNATPTTALLPLANPEPRQPGEQSFAFLADPTLIFADKAQRFVIGVLENIIDSEITSRHTPFSALSLTSLDVVRFLDFWQVLFGQTLPFTLFYQQRTVGALLDYMLEQALLTPAQLQAAAELLANPAADTPKADMPLTELQESFVIGRALTTYGQRVGSTLYFELAIDQDIAITVLESAWNQLVAYHEALHTVINDEAKQVVLSHSPRYVFSVNDLSDCGATDIANQLANSRATLNCHIFDLSHWPCFAIRAFILNDQQRVLQVALDEVMADATSIFMLISQWHNLATDPHYQLPARSYSLRQHLTFLARLRSGAHFQQSMHYWLEKLADIPPGPALKYAAVQHPVEQTVHCLAAEIASECWAALKSEAAALSCSPGAFLLTLFCEVLHQFTGQRRFSLNLTNLNRLAINKQVNGLVGLLANSNIFVSEQQPQQTLSTRVTACQQQLDRDASHSFVGAVSVLRKLRQQSAKRGAIRLPVVFTNLLSTPFPPPALGADWSLQQMMNTTPQVALDHQLFEEDGRLVYRWYVANALLDQGSVMALFEAYRQKLLTCAQAISHGQALANAGDDSTGAFPLSGIQKALFAGQWMPAAQGGKACFCHVEFDIAALDIPRLTVAWNKVVSYHPLLRSYYLASLQQVVQANVADYIIATETCAGSTEEFYRRCDEIRREILATRYSPGKYPGYRLRVCELKEQISRLFINFDFILIDGKSIFLILQQLFSQYQRDDYRPPLQCITFQDVIRIRANAKPSHDDIHSQYWHNKFCQMTPTLNKLTELAHQATLPLPLSQELPCYQQLQTIASRLNVTIDSILLAALGRTLLSWQQATAGSQAPITLAVVCWDRDTMVPESTTGVFTRLSWVTFSSVSDSPTQAILAVQAQLDEDRRHRAVDELEIARHYPGMHFPVVYTTLLTYASDLPTPTYSLSQTPGVVLDNISAVINSSSVRMQWDIVNSAQDIFTPLFQQYLACLEQWLIDNELLTFVQK